MPDKETYKRHDTHDPSYISTNKYTRAATLQCLNTIETRVYGTCRISGLESSLTVCVLLTGLRGRSAVRKANETSTMHFR